MKFTSSKFVRFSLGSRFSLVLLKNARDVKKDIQERGWAEKCARKKPQVYIYLHINPKIYWHDNYWRKWSLSNHMEGFKFQSFLYFVLFSTVSFQNHEKYSNIACFPFFRQKLRWVEAFSMLQILTCFFNFLQLLDFTKLLGHLGLYTFSRSFDHSTHVHDNPVQTHV